MESASQKTVTTLGFRQSIKLVVLEKPSIQGDRNYQEFLNRLPSYNCGYRKRRWGRRIIEFFVVCSLTSPETGKIDKIRIKRKANDSIELEDGSRFDMKTGRSSSGEPKYIFPVEDRRVWVAWEPQSLRQRVERVLPALRLKDLRGYADVLDPKWHFGLFNRSFNCAADSLSERDATTMASCREFAKKTILGHLPGAIQEFRALVEMMEGDSK